MKIWVKYNKQVFGTKYSRMDQVKPFKFVFPKFYLVHS